MSPPPDEPCYPISRVKKLVEAGSYRVTGEALTGAGELGFDRQDIEDCVLTLSIADFYKSMPAELQPGLHQDVYRPIFGGHQLYVKVQISTWNAAGDQAVVISFKRK